MANYYRVSPKYWLFARRHRWTDAQTELGIYLLTCDHRNLEGLYRLPKPYIAADLGWPAKKVEENLAIVLASGFAAYDDDAEMILIPKALKHQAPNTENQIKGAIAQLERIPRTSLWDGFRMACASHCPRLSNAIAERWPSDTEGTSHTRAGSHVRSSSSNSISSSTPPLAPPASPGGNLGDQEQASPVRANSRALGTSGRHQDAAALASRQAAASTLAVDSLIEPGDEHRAGWERLRTALVQSVGGKATMEAYITNLRLAAVDEDVLVLDGGEEAWSWARVRLGTALGEWSGHLGVEARIASADEHDGFRAVAA